MAELVVDGHRLAWRESKERYVRENGKPKDRKALKSFQDERHQVALTPQNVGHLFDFILPL